MYENIEIDALVLRSTKYGDADQILTLLTEEHGKITATAKWSRSIRSKVHNAVNPFVYATFLLRKGPKYWYVQEADIHTTFEGLRYDVERLALATYLCDVAEVLSLEEVADTALLPLTLNILYALSDKQQTPLWQCKAVFELRVMTIAGYTPDLTACGICRSKIREDYSFLDVMNGRVLCPRCREEYIHSPAYLMDDAHGKQQIRLTAAVLCAMQYIVSAQPKKLLSFRLEEKKDIQNLSAACEAYLVHQLEQSFATLAYYHSLCAFTASPYENIP